VQNEPNVLSINPLLAAVGSADAPWVEVLKAADVVRMATENAVGDVPGQQQRLPWRAPVPTSLLVISQLCDLYTTATVGQWLARYYPSEHMVYLIPASTGTDSSVQPIPISQLSQVEVGDEDASLLVPGLAETDNVRTFAGLMQLTRTLRAPGGCAWDREQTHATLKPHLLEETYEVLDALDSAEPVQLAEEMGDLLYQITLHSQIAAEAGAFTIEDVIENVVRKLIGRHPHVFGDMELESSQDVLAVWESFKQKQKPKRTSVLEEIPKGLPALPQSNLMQKRAAHVGFEWPAVSDVLDKVEEELRELRVEIESGEKDQQREELGDIFFALVSVARHLKIDPEEALRRANRKFAGRFGQVEATVSERGQALRDLSPPELDALWNQMKGTENNET